MALLESCTLEHIQVPHLSLWLSTLLCFCWLPTSVPVPGSSHTVGIGMGKGRTGLELPARRGRCCPGWGAQPCWPWGAALCMAEATLLSMAPHFLLPSTIPTGPSSHRAWSTHPAALNRLCRAVCSGWGEPSLLHRPDDGVGGCEMQRVTSAGSAGWQLWLRLP